MIIALTTIIITITVPIVVIYAIIFMQAFVI